MMHAPNRSASASFHGPFVPPKVVRTSRSASATPTRSQSSSFGLIFVPSSFSRAWLTAALSWASVHLRVRACVRDGGGVGVGALAAATPQRALGALQVGVGKKEHSFPGWGDFRSVGLRAPRFTTPRTS
jgi:hypothetical protein